MHARFIFERAPHPSAHAATIAETPDGLVAAWFAGAREGHSKVGIWLAHATADGWAAPREIATGIDGWGRRQPCWNPVLFQTARGSLLLFYRVGPSPRRWWSLLSTSDDGGRSWGPARRLPKGFLGPIKNKPIALPDGTLLCPSSTEHRGWRCHIERADDDGATWERLADLDDGRDRGAIQPTLLAWPDGRIQAFCRTRRGVVSECWSDDGGRSWSPMRATALANPDSGIDATVLADGRAVLVYNDSPRARSPLGLAVSVDGRDWRPSRILEDEPGEFSYPAVIQGRDGRIHVAYTWNRTHIRVATLEPDEL